MVSSLCGELGLLLTAAMLSVGCGTMVLSYDEGTALQAAAAPPASPGFLALLPAKKGKPRDPGEIVERQASYLFARLGLLAIFPIGEVGWRLAPDRAHRVGFEVYAHCEADPLRLFTNEVFHFGAGGTALFAVGSGESFVRAGVLWAPGPSGNMLMMEVGIWKRYGRHWEIGGGAYIMPEVEFMPVFPYVAVHFRL